MNEQESTPDLIFEEDQYFYKGLPFYPLLQDRENEKANTVTIKLDGTIKSNLDWAGPIQAAKQALKDQKLLLWDLDLGLFDRLPTQSLNQYRLSLSLSLKQFRETIWKEFQNETLGLILFSGPALFAEQFIWNEERQNEYLDWKASKLSNVDENFLKSLFCQRVCAQDLCFFHDLLPDELPVYLLLDATTISNPLEQALLLNQELFGRLMLDIKGALIPFKKGILNQIKSDDLIPVSKGVCLPAVEYISQACLNELKRILEFLNNHFIPYCLIPEERLIASWEGLDELFVAKEGVSFTGKRQLLGFCAAGGTIVTEGGLLGLPQEIAFLEWMNIYLQSSKKNS